MRSNHSYCYGLMVISLWDNHKFGSITHIPPLICLFPPLICLLPATTLHFPATTFLFVCSGQLKLTSSSSSAQKIFRGKKVESRGIQTHTRPVAVILFNLALNPFAFVEPAEAQGESPLGFLGASQPSVSYSSILYHILQSRPFSALSDLQPL